MAALIHSHCMSAGLMAQRIGLDRAVGEAVESAFERWDGSGLPRGRRGDEIPLATRVVQLAETCEVHLRTRGVSGALAMARERSGRQFDPSLVDALTACRNRLEALPDEDVWARALEQAPDAHLVLRDGDLDALLGAIGEFADLKCPFTVGHSGAVAELAAAAATRIGLARGEVQVVRRAGLVHDLGRMGVPNSVWEKSAPLSESDRERIRLYPYLTGRILSRVRGLETVASFAETHQERLDGSGYPRRVRGGALPMTQRILAAADSYRGSLEHRPHRPALSPDQAATRSLRRCRPVDSMPPPSTPSWPSPGTSPAPAPQDRGGLTPREVEILSLFARGLSSTDIARQPSSVPRPCATTSSTSISRPGSPTGPALRCSR